MARDASRDYVSNRELLEALTRHKASGADARIPDQVGRAIYLICTRMARRSNFSGYTYVEEMSGDAILNCLRSVRNFDPEKSSNPFGYFSRVAWNTFLHRIRLEQEQTYVKIKNFENLHVLDEMGEFQLQSDRGKPGASHPGNEFTDAFVQNFERLESRRRGPRRRPRGARRK